MRSFIALVLVACIGIATCQAAAPGLDAAQFRQLGHKLDEAMAHMSSHFNNLNTDIMSEKAAPAAPITTQAVSVTCAAAITSFTNAYANTTCAALRASIASYTTATQANVAAWCTSGCIELFTSVNLDISVGCAADRDVWTTYTSTIQLNFRTGVWFSKGICTQVGTSYCWPRLANATALFNIAGNSMAYQVTAAQMEAACGDTCLSKILIAFSSYGYPSLVSQIKAIDIFCLKIDGAYCRYTLNDYSTAITIDPVTHRPSFASLCSSCFLTYIRKTVEFYSTFSTGGIVVNPFASLYTIFDSYCARSPDGGYCFDRFMDNALLYSKMTTDCLTMVSGTGVCTAACSASLVSAATTFGCCIPAAVNLQFAAIAILNPGIAVNTVIYNQCGVNLNVTGSLVGSCSKYLVIGNLGITNLLYSYYSAHAAEVIAAIRADLALILAITIDKITINSVTDTSVTASSGFASQATATSTSVKVAYTVSPSSNAETATVKTALTTQLAVDTSLASTSTLDLSSRADGTSPVAADAASSSQSTVDNPNASEEAANGVAQAASLSMMAIIATMIVAAVNF